MSIFMEIWNRFNKAILPSPLHGITSKNTLLVTYRGSKSGKEYTVPVNYSQVGKTIRITSFPERKWWRSLRSNSIVRLTLRGAVVAGKAKVFENGDAVTEQLGAYLEPNPNMARYFQVGINSDGTLDQQDLRQAAQSRVIIKIELDE